MKSVALIPARSGSKRITDKNIRLLNGKPLMAHTIELAMQSGLFDNIIVATDSEIYADIAKKFGAEVPFLRGSEISGDNSPDIEWVIMYLEYFKKENQDFDNYSILRPTSPFRTADSIRKAYKLFTSDPNADSLRAVEKCKQHPGKMWVINSSKSRMNPLMPFEINGNPWHSNQYSALPEIYVQNASLEIARVEMTLRTKTIAGNSIIPFIFPGYEGFDLNTELDWLFAEYLVDNGLVSTSVESK